MKNTETKEDKEIPHQDKATHAFQTWVKDWIKSEKGLDIYSQLTKFEIGKYLDFEYDEDNKKLTYYINSLSVTKNRKTIDLKVSEGFSFWKQKQSVGGRPWNELFVSRIALEFSATNSKVPKALVSTNIEVIDVLTLQEI